MLIIQQAVSSTYPFRRNFPCMTVTHCDTFSVFPVRARVCTRTGEPVTKRHVSFGAVLRPASAALEGHLPGGTPPRMWMISWSVLQVGTTLPSRSTRYRFVDKVPEKTLSGVRSRSRLTHTCCGTPAVMPWPTRGPTRTRQAYPGHRNISNTVHYAEVAPNRFRGLWKD